MKLEFASSRRVVFGPGILGEIEKAPELEGVGKVLLVCGEGGADPSPVERILESCNINFDHFWVNGEPSIAQVESAAKLARELDCERVIGFGGGSAIDTAKASAALAVNPGELIDYLEVVGGGQKLKVPALGVIAIPTTAGTGSEVTRNAVISVPEYAVKVSLRSPGMLPWLALVDPQLTHSVPRGVTASTGMDALAQVLEPFVSIKANPLTDGFCREGLKRVGKALSAVVKDGNNAQAREDMSYVSLMGGLALANAGLGAVHGFAGPLGGHLNAPHGALCARLLPAVVQVNIRAMRERDPSNQALLRYQEAAQWLMNSNQANADDLSEWLAQLCEELRIPRLAEMGIRRDDFEEIVHQSAAASSMKANPILLTQNEMLNILTQAV